MSKSKSKNILEPIPRALVAQPAEHRTRAKPERTRSVRFDATLRPFGPPLAAFKALTRFGEHYQDKWQKRQANRIGSLVSTLVCCHCIWRVMIKKKAAFSEYRDLERSYMQRNHCLKISPNPGWVGQQLAERAERPQKSRRRRYSSHDLLFPQGVAGVNEGRPEGFKENSKMKVCLNNLKVRLK